MVCPLETVIQPFSQPLTLPHSLGIGLYMYYGTSVRVSLPVLCAVQEYQTCTDTALWGTHTLIEWSCGDSFLKPRIRNMPFVLIFFLYFYSQGVAVQSTSFSLNLGPSLLTLVLKGTSRLSLVLWATSILLQIYFMTSRNLDRIIGWTAITVAHAYQDSLKRTGFTWDDICHVPVTQF